MFVQKICCSKNVVSKERQTDLQFLRRETHLQQRSVYKTAHVSSSSSKSSQIQLDMKWTTEQIVQLLLLVIVNLKWQYLCQFPQRKRRWFITSSTEFHSTKNNYQHQKKTLTLSEETNVKFKKNILILGEVTNVKFKQN